MGNEWIDPSGERVAGVTIQNLTDSPIVALEDLLLQVPGFVLDGEDKALGEIAIVLTSDSHLAEMHGVHLGDPSVTDVMTFPYDDDSGSISGDIVMSVERAMEQAEEEGWTIEDELLFIAIHGMLHLCGWDDRTEASRAAMHRRQHELLGEFRRG